MLRKTITVTEQQDVWIKNQVEQGLYGNDSEYIRSVIRQEMERNQAEQKLKAMIQTAEESGMSSKTPSEIWHDVLAKQSV